MVVGVVAMDKLFRGLDTWQDPWLALIVSVGTDTQIDLGRALVLAVSLLDAEKGIRGEQFDVVE